LFLSFSFRVVGNVPETARIVNASREKNAK
jgi:hypothetical protein